MEGYWFLPEKGQDTDQGISEVRSLKDLVVEGCSSKLGTAVQHHSNLLWLFGVVYAMMWNVPRLADVRF